LFLLLNVGRDHANNDERAVRGLDSRARRYAWFAPRTGAFDWIGPSASLLQPGQAALTPLGMLYAGAAAASASAPAAARQRPEGAAAPGGAAAPRLPADAAQEPATSPGPPAARPHGAAPAGAVGAAPAAAPAAARGGGWRALCGACTDQGAGLAGLPPAPRAARQAHCRRECGFWSYGTGLRSVGAGVPQGLPAC